METKIGTLQTDVNKRVLASDIQTKYAALQADIDKRALPFDFDTV